MWRRAVWSIGCSVLQLVIFQLCLGLLTAWIKCRLASTPKAHKSIALLTVLFNARYFPVNYTIIVRDEQWQGDFPNRFWTVTYQSQICLHVIHSVRELADKPYMELKLTLKYISKGKSQSCAQFRHDLRFWTKTLSELLVWSAKSAKYGAKCV
jgi:hypothetical protein